MKNFVKNFVQFGVSTIAGVMFTRFANDFYDFTKDKLIKEKEKKCQNKLGFR